MHIDDTIGGLKRGQETGLKNVTVRDLTILKHDMMKAIQNEPYKRALKEYAGDSAMVNAIEDGFENAFKMAPEEIRKTIAHMTPGEQQLWRLGFSRAVVDRLSKGRYTLDRVKTLDSPEMMSRLRAAFPDLQGFRRLEQAMARENAMTATRSAAQGNSTTARQIMEGQDAAKEADFMAGSLEALRGDFLGLAQRLGKRFTGMNPRAAARF